MIAVLPTAVTNSKLGLATIWFLAIPPLSAATYSFSIDTSAVAGTSGFLDFKFTPSSPASQPATLQLLNFDPAIGALNGVPSLTGNVTGSLPGILSFQNTAALNEYLQSFTYQTKIFFTIVISGPAVDTSDGTAAGSTFSLTLYDATMTPILTNQASGFIGQLNINPDGSVTPLAYSSGASAATIAGPLDDVYQVRYISNIGRGDGVIDITNAGSLGGDPAG